MKYEIIDNKILIHQKELDIYDAIELKNLIQERNGNVIIDLKEVESIFTSVIQVLISARKSYENFSIENLHQEVQRNFYLLGIEI